VIDSQLLDAAIRMVARYDWQGLALERGATEVGTARSTL